MFLDTSTHDTSTRMTSEKDNSFRRGMAEKHHSHRNGSIPKIFQQFI